MSSSYDVTCCFLQTSSLAIKNESAPIKLAISNAKMSIYFQIKYIRKQFYQTALQTVMVRNYQNADCSLRKNMVSFIIIFGTLSFPIAAITARLCLKKVNVRGLL